MDTWRAHARKNVRCVLQATNKKEHPALDSLSFQHKNMVKPRKYKR